MATLGQVGNVDRESIVIGKAGRIATAAPPTVRGSVMNPRDHPHSGGEGSADRRPTERKWGKPVRRRPATTNGQIRSCANASGSRRGGLRGEVVKKDLHRHQIQEKIQTLNQRTIAGSSVGTGVDDFPGMWGTPAATTRSTPVFISEQMVRHKLGEFAPTRTRACKDGRRGRR
jgi:hypothetical protein